MHAIVFIVIFMCFLVFLYLDIRNNFNKIITRRIFKLVVFILSLSLLLIAFALLSLSTCSQPTPPADVTIRNECVPVCYCDGLSISKICIGVKRDTCSTSG